VYCPSSTDGTARSSTTGTAHSSSDGTARCSTASGTVSSNDDGPDSSLSVASAAPEAANQPPCNGQGPELRQQQQQGSNAGVPPSTEPGPGLPSFKPGPVPTQPQHNSSSSSTCGPNNNPVAPTGGPPPREGWVGGMAHSSSSTFGPGNTQGPGMGGTRGSGTPRGLLSQHSMSSSMSDTSPTAYGPGSAAGQGGFNPGFNPGGPPYGPQGQREGPFRGGWGGHQGGHQESRPWMQQGGGDNQGRSLMQDLGVSVNSLTRLFSAEADTEFEQVSPS
jgi:hypothetical protein